MTYLRIHASLLLTALFLGACASPEGGQDAALRSTEAGAPIAEEKVAKGLNDVFLSSELDVDSFTEIFEGESREVFTLREEITTALGYKAGMAVADIGAGTGLFMKLMADQVGAEGIVYAVDISPVFLKHLRERADEEGLPQIQPVLCGTRSADLAAASVDAAFVCDTYHHFDYPASTLASLFSAIRPGGELVVIDFERIPGVTSDWLMEHVRDGKEVFRAEIEAAGFGFVEEVEVGLEENYFLRFRRP